MLTYGNTYPIIDSGEMSEHRHSKKEIADAIKYAEEKGWTVVYGGKRHVYAILYCPGGSGCCGPYRVYSTPKNPGNTAKQIRHAVDRCDHKESSEEK